MADLRTETSRHTVSLIPLSSGLVRTAFPYHATLLSHDLPQAGSDLTSPLLLLSLHSQQRTDCAQVRLMYQAGVFFYWKLDISQFTNAVAASFYHAGVTVIFLLPPIMIMIMPIDGPPL